MRLAVLCDIHGNLPALEAVLAEVQTEAVDRVVIGGDVLPGPMPAQCMKLLLGLRIPTDFVFGNGEVAIREVLDGKTPSKVPEQYLPQTEWTARALGPAYLPILSAWPKTLRLSHPSLGRLLFCHATPRDENEIFTKRTAEEKLQPIFDAADADLVVCGHTHMPFDRMIGRTRVVNPGSVGMPYGGTGAFWLLIDSELEFRRTPYDLPAAGTAIRATGDPGAEDAAESILNPAPEDVVLDIFGKAEIPY